MIADLDLYALAPGYAQEEGLMTDMARALGGELRTNPAWAFLGKPVTVHNQGGCRMSDDPDDGVTTEFGEVRGCDGLFVADGSLLCTSVGVNPSATIAAIAEHNVHAFIRKVRSHEWPEGDTSDGAREYGEQRERARAWAEKAKREKWAITPPYAQGAELRAIESQPLGIEFDEVMDGYYAETDKQPVLDGEFRKLETLGRPSFPVRLKLHVDVDDLAAFFEDDDHRMALSGEVVLRLPGGARPETCAVREGTLRLFVPRSKSYAIDEADTIRREAQRKIAGKYRPTRRRASRDEERRLDYDVSFSDASGLPWRLLGFKRVRDDPAIDAWRDTSSLFVTLCEGAGAAAPPVVRGAGVAHVEMTAFLFDQVPSVQAKRCDRKRGVSGVVTTVGKIDLAREAWAVAAFSAFFFGSLQRIYVPEVKTALDSLFHARRHVPPPPPPRTAPRP
jgi:cholesterol oxidase